MLMKKEKRKSILYCNDVCVLVASPPEQLDRSSYFFLFAPSWSMGGLRLKNPYPDSSLMERGVWYFMTD